MHDGSVNFYLASYSSAFLGVCARLTCNSAKAVRFSIELGAGHTEDSAAVRGTYLDTSSGYGQVGAWFGLVQSL